MIKKSNKSKLKPKKKTKRNWWCNGPEPLDMVIGKKMVFAMIFEF